MANRLNWLFTRAIRPFKAGCGFAEKEKSRKGMFFALSVLLLVSTLIALASGISDVTSRTRRSATAIIDIDFAARAHADVSAQAVKILASWSNVTCTGNKISMTETLPRPNTYAADLQNLAEFSSGSEFLRANISANFSNLEIGRFEIVPQGVEIAHTSDTIYFKSNNSSVGDQVSSINLTIVFPAGTIDSANWSVLSSGSNATGMNVSVLVMDASYSVYTKLSATIDRNSESVVNITRDGNEIGHVRFYAPSTCEIYHTNKINLKAMIEMTNQVYAQTYDNITVTNGRATKATRVQIC